MRASGVSIRAQLAGVSHVRGVDFEDGPVHVAVASENPVKLSAARAAFKRMFPEADIEIHPLSVSSGVPEQPFGDDTLVGACNRALGAWRAAKEASTSNGRNSVFFGVGLEGGCYWGPDRTLMASAEFIVIGCDGRYGHGTAASFEIPTPVAALIEGGMELGHAIDKVFDRTNCKQKEGAIGDVTGGVITRMEFCVPPLIMALGPWGPAKQHYAMSAVPPAAAAASAGAAAAGQMGEESLDEPLAKRCSPTEMSA